MIYTSTSTPDHDFISTYNSNIQVEHAPNQTSQVGKGIISDAWMEILSVSPSVYYQTNLYVPSSAEARTAYNYQIRVPQNYDSTIEHHDKICKERYRLLDSSEDFSLWLNGNYIGNQKSQPFTFNGNATLHASLYLYTTLEKKEYRWREYCCKTSGGKCKKFCHSCDFTAQTTQDDTLHLQDSLNLTSYNHNLQSNFTITHFYNKAYKGKINHDNHSSLKITLTNSSYSLQEFTYFATFIHQPYNVLQLHAQQTQEKNTRNLIQHEQDIFVKNVDLCQVHSSNFFESKTKECTVNLQQSQTEKTKRTPLSTAWNLLLTIGVFGFINYILYIVLKKYWGKLLIPSFLFLLFIPIAFAETECGLTNLASCIPLKIYDFIIQLLNAPLQPLLFMVKTLLEAAPSISLFQGIWAIIIYCISLFYGLLFMYSGFQFIISGHNIVKREMAKEWLKNTVVMIVLIQASFYLYSLVIELSALLTTAVLSLVNPDFFLLTMDNINNIGLEFLYFSFYVLVLFVTCLFLVMRYLIVACGVLLVPFAIFCYFIPPLRGYGKLLFHLLGLFLFITFFQAIIILACSLLIQIPFFENIKMLVMIVCYLIIIFTYLIAIKKAITESCFQDHSEKVAQAVKHISFMI